MRRSANAATASAVPSVDASSTTMISKSWQVWARTLSMARRTVAGRLNTGITTLTLGSIDELSDRVTVQDVLAADGSSSDKCCPALPCRGQPDDRLHSATASPV